MKRKTIILSAAFLGLQLLVSGCAKDNVMDIGTEAGEITENIEKESMKEESEERDAYSGTVEDTDNLADEDISGGEQPVGFVLTDCEVSVGQNGYYIVESVDTSLYGLVDANGTSILPMEYDDINFSELENANAVIVYAEGKYGLYDCQGREILPVTYDKIDEGGGERYLVEKDGKQSIIGLDGSLVADLQGTYEALYGNSFLSAIEMADDGCMYTELYDLDENKIQVSVSKDKKANLGKMESIIIDGTELLLVNGIYDMLSSDFYMLLNADGEEVCSVISDQETTAERSSLFSVNSDKILGMKSWSWGSAESSGTYYLYNISTQTRSEEEYSSIIDFGEGIYAQREDGVDLYGRDGNLIRTIEFEENDGIELSIYHSLIVVQYGDTYRVYNSEGKEVTEDRYLDFYSYQNHLLVQNLDGEYGMMNEQGEMVIPFGMIQENQDSDQMTYNGEIWEDGDTDFYDGHLYLLTETNSGMQCLYIL